MMIYDRPISAKSTEEKRKSNKIGPAHHILSEKLGYEVGANSSSAKKRYPSTNPKDDLFRWK